MTQAHDRPLCTEDRCPECGAYYVLIERAPHVPWLLQETGDDEDIEAWEAEHDYNVIECSRCGWCSDQD